MKTSTLASSVDDLFIEELDTPKVKKTKSAKKKTQESSWDLLWTLFAVQVQLLGRVLSFAWKNKGSLTISAFFVENILLLQLHFHFIK